MVPFFLFVLGGRHGFRLSYGRAFYHYNTSYQKLPFGSGDYPDKLLFLTHQTRNYPVTCFVSKPSRIILVELSYHLCGMVKLNSAQREWSYILRIVCMVGHPRVSYIVYSLLSLEVATPENKSIHSTLSFVCTKIRLERAYCIKMVGCSPPSMRLTNTSRRFALGASDVCLVGENPTCSVPALQGCEGLWSYRYGDI